MLHKKFKKIICIMSAVIIAFSCYTLPASAATDDVIFSSGNLKDIFPKYGPDVMCVSPTSTLDEYVSGNVFRFILNGNIENGILNKKITFTFSTDFLIDKVSRGKSYRFLIPFVFQSWHTFEYSDCNIRLCIEYDDGSKSSIIASASDYEIKQQENDQWRNLTYIDFDFNITGDKLLNIKESYFEFDYYFNTANIDKDFTIHLGIPANEIITVKEFEPEYDSFFKSSVSWMSDIFTKVTAEPALTVLVLGFVIVSFGFLLLRRLVRG